MFLICECGQPIESSGVSYRFQSSNEKGEIIEQVCSHGIKVIDKVAADADRIRREFRDKISGDNINS